MENKLKDAFERIRMPDKLALDIGKTLVRQPESREGKWHTSGPVVTARFGWLKAAGAVAVLLAVALVAVSLRTRPGEQVNTAVDLEETTKATLPEEKLLPPELAAAKAEFEGGLIYAEGNVLYSYSGTGNDLVSDVRYNTLLHSPFTEYVDGRVYFIANGEYLDITEQFSEEEPFTYIFTDSHYIIHYIAIGGTPEDIGCLEQLQLSWEPGVGGCLGGFSVNTWNDETDARWGWERRAKEIFMDYGVYWVS